MLCTRTGICESERACCEICSAGSCRLACTNRTRLPTPRRHRPSVLIADGRAFNVLYQSLMAAPRCEGVSKNTRATVDGSKPSRDEQKPRLADRKHVFVGSRKSFEILRTREDPSYDSIHYWVCCWLSPLPHELRCWLHSGLSMSSSAKGLLIRTGRLR